jgi:hypothetical protein
MPPQMMPTGNMMPTMYGMPPPQPMKGLPMVPSQPTPNGQFYQTNPNMYMMPPPPQQTYMPMPGQMAMNPYGQPQQQPNQQNMIMGNGSTRSNGTGMNSVSNYQNGPGGITGSTPLQAALLGQAGPQNGQNNNDVASYSSQSNGLGQSIGLGLQGQGQDGHSLQYGSIGGNYPPPQTSSLMLSTDQMFSPTAASGLWSAGPVPLSAHPGMMMMGSQIGNNGLIQQHMYQNSLQGSVMQMPPLQQQSMGSAMVSNGMNSIIGGNKMGGKDGDTASNTSRLSQQPSNVMVLTQPPQGVNNNVSPRPPSGSNDTKSNSSNASGAPTQQLNRLSLVHNNGMDNMGSMGSNNQIHGNFPQHGYSIPYQQQHTPNQMGQITQHVLSRQATTNSNNGLNLINTASSAAKKRKNNDDSYDLGSNQSNQSNASYNDTMSFNGGSAGPLLVKNYSAAVTPSVGLKIFTEDKKIVCQNGIIGYDNNDNNDMRSNSSNITAITPHIFNDVNGVKINSSYIKEGLKNISNNTPLPDSPNPFADESPQNLSGPLINQPTTKPKLNPGQNDRGSNNGHSGELLVQLPPPTDHILNTIPVSPLTKGVEPLGSHFA